MSDGLDMCCERGDPGKHTFAEYNDGEDIEKDSKAMGIPCKGIER